MCGDVNVNKDHNSPTQVSSKSPNQASHARVSPLSSPRLGPPRSVPASQSPVGPRLGTRSVPASRSPIGFPLPCPPARSPLPQIRMSADPRSSRGRVLSTSGLKRSSSLREDSGSSPVGYRAPVMGDKLAISSLRWSSGRGEMVAVPRELQSFSHQGEGSRLQPDMKLKSWGRKWPSSGEFWSPGLGRENGSISTQRKNSIQGEMCTSPSGDAAPFLG
ncbi:unnamed protein product [Boreogadus saida]